MKNPFEGNLPPKDYTGSIMRSPEARAAEKEEALKRLMKRRTQAMLDGNTEEVHKIGQAIEGLRKE